MLKTNNKQIAISRIKDITYDDNTSQTTVDSGSCAVGQGRSVTIPHPTAFDKAKEAGRLGLVRVRVFWQDLNPEEGGPHIMLLPSAKYSHRYVEPLCFWWGKNSRLLVGQSLPSAD